MTIDVNVQPAEEESVATGGASTMPVTGACCGIRPSKEAMETDFAIDFSQARQFLENKPSQIPQDEPE